ncbi:hypothetical protein [Kitasatospora camelliae]|uniref:Lipocalin-like domain-containing protein n=1 Tax=Kitasatospora camelliae TaxID=3156397 RepID=A0AAU8K3S9_9ACTN
MTDTATSARPRTAQWRILGLLLALAFAVTGFVATPASADKAPRTLQGTWRLTVTVYAPTGPAVTDPVFVFHADHTLNATGPIDETGQPAYRATGFWTNAKDGDIAFYITHPGRADGAILGTVQAIHLGKLKGDKFSTKANAFVHQEEGAPLLGPITVTSEGAKLSDAS